MEKNENFKTELEKQYTILIKSKEKKEFKGLIIILSILSVTYISVIISIFFAAKAYNASTSMQKETESKSNVYYQTLSTTYTNTSNIELNNITTGYRLQNPKIIEITNDGNTETMFNLKITSISTSLISANNLFYTLTRNNDTSVTKQIPLSDKIIAENIKIAPKETVTYTLNIYFNGVLDQTDSNNYYRSKIVVEQVDNKFSLLE